MTLSSRNESFASLSLVHPATLAGSLLWAAHSCLSSCLSHFPEGLSRMSGKMSANLLVLHSMAHKSFSSQNLSLKNSSEYKFYVYSWLLLISFKLVLHTHSVDYHITVAIWHFRQDQFLFDIMSSSCLNSWFTHGSYWRYRLQLPNRHTPKMTCLLLYE